MRHDLTARRVVALSDEIGAVGSLDVIPLSSCRGVHELIRAPKCPQSGFTGAQEPRSLASWMPQIGFGTLRPSRPDICIGTDQVHTPEWLQQTACAAFSNLGWRVDLNRPYSGTVVPGSFYRKDAHVHSVMVEVNRSLYMNEDTGERSAGFDGVRLKVQSVLETLIESSEAS